MSKDLPYFKFFPDQWLSGDITLEEMDLQGVFINVCSIYWSKDCRVALAKLKQRFKGDMDKLIESGLIKEKEGFAVIEFLDEQWVELSARHQKNVENGRLGGLKSREARAPLKHLDKIRKDKIRKDKSNTAFSKPTIEEVKAYCIERKNQVDPQKWIDHYTSNGWKVGKNSMKDWKAAVRTWEKSEYAATTSKPARVDKAAPPLYGSKS